MSLEEQLIKAAHAGDLTGVEAALKAGADVHAQDDLALKWAAQNGHLVVVEMLIEAGANIHSKYDWALSQAANNGHLEVVQVLIKAGADVHTDNDCALRWAAWNSRIQVIKELVAAGANPDHPCLEEAAQRHAALRAWLEHRRLTQAQPETQPNPARRGLSRANH